MGVATPPAEEAPAATQDAGVAKVHMRADPGQEPAPAVLSLTPGQLRDRRLEKEIATAIKQMKGSLDGTVELLYMDGTSGLKAPGKHRLDEVGGVDGMRVVFRGQVGNLLRQFPARGGARLVLKDRHVRALKLCDEHAARSDAFGAWLTEQNAAKCAQECVFFLQALHVVMQPYPEAVKDTVMAAYWGHRDPERALEMELS
jgi:hypothetical protein